MISTPMFDSYRKIYAYVHNYSSPLDTSPNLDCPVSIPDFRHTLTIGKAAQKTPLSKQLKKLQINSGGLINNILVHGSVGDFSSVPFSDLDATLFISDEVIYSKVGLYNLKLYIKNHLSPFLYSYDPLQHHGFFLLWPELCRQYDEAILPPVVYTSAWSLNGIELKIHCKNNSSKGRFYRMLIQLRNRILVKKTWSSFEYKNMLSHILILPSLYYTGRGESLLKSNSYEPFCSRFPEYEDCFNFASLERTNWQQRRKYSASLLMRIGCYCFQGRLPRLLSLLSTKNYLHKTKRSLIIKSINGLITNVEHNADH